MKILNSNLVQLVKLLNDGQYHSGEQLGKTLNISRSAIWKAIKKLKEDDITISSIKEKGYALAHPLILLDKKCIRKYLINKHLDITIFENIHSTNDFFLKNPGENKLKFCLTEQQTHGKGRFGRPWHSPFGQNIYFSCVYPFKKELSELGGLSLVVSLAIVKTINTYSLPQSPLIKWPNDIIYENKKMSGTLIEVQAEGNGRSVVVIGIGMNVNMLPNKNHSISQAWTSMQMITNNYIDRNQFCALLINYLLIYLNQFEKQGLPSFREEWKKVDSIIGKEVTLKIANQKIRGTSQGIDHQGHLLLKLQDNKVRAFSSGDVSLSRAY